MLLFSTGRQRRRVCCDLKLYDYEYYKEKGWFESGYYYDVHLGPMQRVVGRFSDLLGRKFFK